MEVCINFLGNLSSFFGNKICLDLSSCPTIKEVMSKLINEYKAPITTEHIIYIGNNGTTLSGEESICKFNMIYVLRALQGG